MYKLIALELVDLKNEYKDTLANIKEYKSILKEKDKASDLIINDIKEIKKNYAIDRKTTFEDAKEIELEPEEKVELPCVYVQNKFGYCKLLEPSAYEKNKDQVLEENQYAYESMTSDKAIIFGSSGNMYQIKLDNVPMQKIKDKGKAIDNLCKFNSNEETAVNVFTDKVIKDAYLFMVTKLGLIKYVDTSEFVTQNTKIAGTKLNNKDELAKVLLSYADKDIVIRTNNNLFLRLKPKDIPLLKRAGKGVKGITLKGTDYVIDAYIADKGTKVEVDGKQVSLDDLKPATRATKGQTL